MLTFTFTFTTFRKRWSCNADSLTEALAKFKKAYPNLDETSIRTIETQ